MPTTLDVHQAVMRCASYKTVLDCHGSRSGHLTRTIFCSSTRPGCAKIVARSIQFPGDKIASVEPDGIRFHLPAASALLKIRNLPEVRLGHVTAPLVKGYRSLFVKPTHAGMK